MTKDSWRTPPEVFAWASSLVGGFQFDAACTRQNGLAQPLWALPQFKHGDSLSARWPDDPAVRIWCNPPYSDMDPWIKASIEVRAMTAMLIMSPNGEGRYGHLLPVAHEIAIVGDTYRVSGRIGFIGIDGEPVNSNTRGSSLFIINPSFGVGQRSWVNFKEVMRIGRALLEATP